MSAGGYARSDSAWMVETNCEPMMPTPTCFMLGPRCALSASPLASSKARLAHGCSPASSKERGTVSAAERRGDVLRVRVGASGLEGLAAGGSIAVNGCCLTAVEVDDAAASPAS